MSILDMFKNKEESTEQAETVVAVEAKTAEQATEVKKPKHGEEVFCCGGCQ
jgi:CCGSCS motif protein